MRKSLLIIGQAHRGWDKMPQGGFGRDFQQVTQLQNRAAEKQLVIEREKIVKEMMEKVLPHLKEEMKKVEETVVQEYENSLHEMSDTIKQKDKTLKFLIYVSSSCLMISSLLLGYLTARWF